MATLLASLRFSTDRIQVQIIEPVGHPRELALVPHPADQRAYRQFLRPGKMTGKIHKKS